MNQQRSRRQRNAATIKDVARKAGVSPMTVSRVLNAKHNVHPTTREAVNAAITALSYTPNPAARSLAGAAPVRIGLLYSNPSAAYLSEFLVGSLDYASRANIQIIVEKCDGPEQAREAATRLLRGGVEGIVLPPPLCDSLTLLEALREANGLAVTVASGHPAPGFSAVSIDDHRAAFEMTRHIAALGHQRIGFIIGNPDQTASERRLAGYRDALDAVGLPYDADLVAQGLFTYRSGLDVAEQLLDLANPPSAIFASNDDMAAATVAVAHRHGLDVPNDLTVCGFDDTALATTIWPELTTIHQPITDMSLAAVELLVKEILDRRAGHRQAPRHLQLGFRLVRRQSDAAPRRRPLATTLRLA
ncbi:LacI family DNA-binding transcriptional regulator [Sphingomonas sp. QA11]|uniref:LacI family DNA-binding transcriptional regulator n=1 Tax=Sphingomonas sp. QA11 TaxID=2950605 RepID=UPI00234A7034|nr:LacI family DNA-binding transcriptional regulator [Sphingomonas sp. QA11]WCM25114.1 LacI family DNA-binding transcriptional regulator [Sphingomonas sp. QA11]